jgi:hypothetical protein
VVDACALKAKWGEMDAAERLEALKEIINEMLTEWGYDEVDVEQGHLPGALGNWTYDENTVYLDYEKTLERDDFGEALNTAIHEAAHAARDMEHGEPMPTGGGHTVPDDVFGEFAVVGEEVEFFEPGEFVPSPEHQEAYTAAEEWTDELMSECPDVPKPPAPAQYGAATDAPAMNFTEEEMEAMMEDDEELPDGDYDLMPDGDLD